MAQFSITTKVFFGPDANSGLFSRLKALKVRSPVFITDKNLSGTKAFTQLLSTYENAGFKVGRIESCDCSAEPTYDYLDEFVMRFKGKEPEALIGAGGGSAMDIAKGVAVLLKNPGKAIDFRGMDKAENSPLALACYPATAGTGSEVTHTASFIDTASKTKLGINGRNVAPLFAVLMPELTFSCPRDATVSSGLDAMVHAIEAVTSRNANQLTAMIGSRAFGLLYNNFKQVLSQPQNYEAREAMLMGSYLAGIAMMNAGGGPASGISYPLGVHFAVPHGLAGGIFLPHIFEYNVSNGYYGYSVAYDEIIGIDSSLLNKKKAEDFVVRFRDFYRQIGAPENLRPFNVGAQEAEILADLTLQQRKANLELNPVDFIDDEVSRLINKVI